MSAVDTSVPPRGLFQLVVDEVPLAVPRDALLSLEDACDLPRLMGNFNKRHLLRAIDGGRGPLRGYQPTKAGWFTTPADIDDWINKSCPTLPSPQHPHLVQTAASPDSGSTRPRTGGSSSMGPSASIQSAALARALKLSKS